MCNPLKALDRAVGTDFSGNSAPAPAPGTGAVDPRDQKGAPAPAPTPAPAPAPAPAPTPAPAPPTIDYNALASGYTNFARPQIDAQYGKASDALTTGLAERGLAGSNIGREYAGNLKSTYDTQIAGLPNAANTYAHGDTSQGYTPLGDLFTKLIQPVATFNANNRYTAPAGMAPIAGAASVGSGASSGASNVFLSNGNSSRVVS